MKPGTILRFSEKGIEYLYGNRPALKREEVALWRFVYLGVPPGVDGAQGVIKVVKLGTQVVTGYHRDFLQVYNRKEGK